jgi:hypothetical protein
MTVKNGGIEGVAALGAGTAFNGNGGNRPICLIRKFVRPFVMATGRAGIIRHQNPRPGSYPTVPYAFQKELMFFCSDNHWFVSSFLVSRILAQSTATMNGCAA